MQFNLFNLAGYILFAYAGEWRKRTGLQVPDSFIETPQFSGRVIAGIYNAINSATTSTKSPFTSGEVYVVAEAAKQLGIRDVSNTLPPSIRSLKFLIPSITLNAIEKTAPLPNLIRDFLISISPDILLPMSLMRGGAPPPTQSNS